MMQKFTYILTITILLTTHLSESHEYMQPFKKDGRYYYSKDHAFAPISLSKIARFAQSKISLKLFVKKVHSFMSKNAYADAVKLLKPTATIPEKESIEPVITWIGHATFLIQINGFNILTDPVFGDVKYGMLTITKRGIPLGITLENLPPIDAILISHDHTDHLDTESLSAIAKKHNPVVYVASGHTELIKQLGFKNVIENTWWEENVLTKNDRSAIFTCLPANHWCMHSIKDYRQRLCCSWMISASWMEEDAIETKNTNIYFAGDTAHGPHFKQIAQRFSSIDMALLPIAPTQKGESSCHRDVHIDAPDVIDAFIDLQAHCFVPMHYGTFYMDAEYIEYPITKMYRYWREKQDQLSGKKLLFARCGEQHKVHGDHFKSRHSILQYPYELT